MLPEIPVERMVLAVLPNDDANTVQAALVEDEFRVTRINTTGGFLRRGNVTLLVGVAEREVEAVIEHIRARVSAGSDGESSNRTGSAMLVVLPVSVSARV
ncbi:MAG: cyclic-di-AMP receptor [Chloroflexi bacterium]|nr:cyclic-di-AMP receptor [Chloroflexota bacterium]